jgi:lipoprotein NlpI
MSKYNTDLDYVILDIDISREELVEIKAEADKIISENKKKKKDEDTRKTLALAYLKKAQCRRRLESGVTCEVILYENIAFGLFKKTRKSIKKLLKKALKLSPDMPEALMQMGIINEHDFYGCIDYKAISFISMAIQIKPDYAAAFNNRAMCYRSLDEVYLTDNQEKKDEFEKDQFEKNKGKFKNAVADLTEAIKIRPFDAVYYLNRGVFHSRLGEHKEAVEDFSNAINYASDIIKEPLKKDEEIFNLRGKEYMELKEYGKAIEDFSETLNLKPHDDTLLLRGKAYYLAGEKDKSKADIDEYLNRKHREADIAGRKKIHELTGINPEDIL